MIGPMTHTSRSFTLALSTLLLSIPPAFANETPSFNAQGNAQWNAQMVRLASALREFLPDLYNKKRFNDPEQEARLRKEAEKFTKAAHDLGPMAKSADFDPSLTILWDSFDREMGRGLTELRRGNREYARGVFRGATQYCVACHTRDSSGPSYTGWDFDLSGLDEFEKAEALIATRQFDSAMKTIRGVLAQGDSARTVPIAWQKAARLGLAVAVRHLDSPEEAGRTVEQVLGTASLPGFVREDAQAWSRSITSWKKEGKRKTTSDQGLLTEMKRLLADAQKQQRYVADHAGDISYLRVTAVAHRLMREYPKSKLVPESLLAAGMAYQALQDLDLWFLHEAFYENCIRRAPKTMTARSCFVRLEESMAVGYSGSAGTEIPDEAQAKLNELKKLTGT